MRKVLLTLMIVACAATSNGIGIPDMKFRRMDTRDGMVNSTVNSLLRDSHGFMWFGTPFGLCRYDGYRFRTYFSFERDTTTMRSSRVDQVFEAHDGRLWINHGMYYSVLDPLTERADRTPSVWLGEQGVKGNLEYVHIDKAKNYWVKTYDQGFYFFNPYKKLVKRIPMGYEPGTFPIDFGLAGFCEGKDGMLIVSNRGELVCVDGENAKIKWKEDYVKRQANIYADYGVFYDEPNGFTWVLPHTAQTFIRVDKENRWYSSLAEMMRSEGFQDVTIPDDVIVWETNYDRNGYLWIATDHWGVLVLDFKQKQWRQFTYSKVDESTIPETTARHVYRDQYDRMWVTSFKNGVAMNSEALTNFLNLPVGDINTVCEDKQGYYWLGLNSGGILKMDPKTHEVVDSFSQQRLGAKRAIMVSSYAAKDGTLWFGTWEGGLLRYRNGEWTNYTANQPGSKLPTNNIWGITEDHWGNIWLAVLGGGVVRIDRHTGAQRVFTDKNSYLKTVWSNNVAQAANGWIIVGNSEYCALIHPLTFKIINMPLPHVENSYTLSAASTQILMDERNLIWQAAPTGLSISDRSTGRNYLLDMKSGFYGSNVSSIVEDARGTMWVVTDHGVSNVIPQKDEDGQWTFMVRSFNDRDGLQPGPFNQRAICYTHDGKVLVGGLEGLDIIDTKKLAEQKIKEKPVFSGLILFNDLVEAGQEYNGRVILEQTLSQTEGISLKYSENQFTIELASDNGGIKNKKRFAYRLEGFNDKWMKTTAISSDVTYMGLPSGSYTLCVRMLNDDGTMGEEESRLDITIAAPWYRSWWAYLFYILIFLAVIWWWRKNFIHRQDLQMELETFRRETEKEQWMNEMRRKLREEQQEKVQKLVTRDDISLEKTQGDIVDFVRQQTELFRAPEGKKLNMAFNSTVEQLIMSFDASQLGQALQLLMTNSLRFSPLGCDLQVSMFNPSDYQVKILVADNGVGIKDEYKAHVFEHVEVEGEELKLDLVKAIIEAHDGDIRITDNPGGGTVFTITLPVEHDEIIEAEPIE